MVNRGRGNEEQELACAGVGLLNFGPLSLPLGLSMSVNALLTLPTKGPLVFFNILQLTERSPIGRYTSQIPKLPEAVFESCLFKP